MVEHTRRALLNAAGGSAIAIAVAGCLGSDDDETYEIAPEDEIVLEGYVSHWVGIEPDPIADVRNPTLVLEAGESYTMEWINSGDMIHDLAIWDDDGEVVDDLITDEVGADGEGDTLEFTADPEMANYVCTLHSSDQIGHLVVE